MSFLHLKKISAAIRWLRLQLRALPPLDQALVIIAFVLISLRIILPIWHQADGHLLFWYPFNRGELCIQRDAGCSIDRSRTAVEAGSIGLFAVGILMIRRGKK